MLHLELADNNEWHSNKTIGIKAQMSSHSVSYIQHEAKGTGLTCLYVAWDHALRGNLT